MPTIIFDIICEKDGVLSKITYDLREGHIYRNCIINKLKETNQKKIVYMSHHYSHTPNTIYPTDKIFIQNINNRL